MNLVTLILLAVVRCGFAINDPILHKATLVKELGSKSFEHDTQSSTGATTGDWFIMFFAPWCGFCQNLLPTWNELASELDQQINIATVDATLFKDLSKRFNISSYPTLIFLSKGTMYKYKGPRDLESLKAFALGGFESQDGEVIPPPIPFMDFVNEQIHYIKSDLRLIFIQAKFVGALIVGISFIIGFVLRGFFVTSVKPSSSKRGTRTKKD